MSVQYGRCVISALTKTERLVALWVCTLICFIAGICPYANAEVPRRVVETNAGQGEAPFEQTLEEGRALLPGHFGFKAQVQLPLVDGEYVVDRLPLELGGVPDPKIVTLSAPHTSAEPRALDRPPRPAPQVQPNLLDADELWLTYRPKPGASQCELTVNIGAKRSTYDNVAEAVPLADRPLRLTGQNQRIRSVDVILEGEKVLPRDASYLILRQIGATNDSNWRVVDEAHRRVFMRLTHIDLRDIDSIELEMDGAVEFVNFRLRRKDTGKPTDTLAWDEIPKKVVKSGDGRRVHLDLAGAIRKQMPGVLESGTTLDLAEVIAFVPNDIGYRPGNEGPIHYLKANYAAPVASGEGVINLPAKAERVGPDAWRWRMSLASLRDAKLGGDIEFLQGRIVPKGESCVAAIEHAEFVRLARRKIPVVVMDFQNSTRALGGPFGLVQEGSEAIELPEFLARSSLDMLSHGRPASIILPPKKRQMWGDIGLSVVSHSASPLTLTAGASGLRLQGSGDVELQWSTGVVLPAGAYLSVSRPVDNGADGDKGKITLRFSDGHAETQLYSLGDAIALHRFAGRTLVDVDLLLNLPVDKNNAVSISEMALFTVKAVTTAQALRGASFADRILDTYRVKLGDMELAPKLPTGDFWSDLSKEGRAWLDYGDMRWNGGAAMPVPTHLERPLGEVTEWRFTYQGGADSRYKAWQSAQSSSSDTGGVSARWPTLALFMLSVIWTVVLWRRGHLRPIAEVVWSRLLRLFEKMSYAERILVRGFWDFSVRQRHAINLLAVLSLWGVGFYWLARNYANPLWDELLQALMVLTLFAGLNIWRWRLQESAAKPNESLRRWIVGHGIWPPRIIWAVVAMVLVFMSWDLIGQFKAAAGIKDFARFFSDMGWIGGVTLIAVGTFMDGKSLAEWVPMLLVVFYGFIPWLSARAFRMTGPNARLARWLAILFSLYAVGLTHIGQHGENYYFTLGNMVVVVIWCIWIVRMKECLQLRWPTAAEMIYRSAGSICFSGALVGLALTALLLMVRLELLAEQAAVVVYYCLVAGTLLEIVALRRAQSAGDTNKQPELSA